MALKVTITTLNETYRLSGHTLEDGGYCYEGRIRNPVTLEQVTKADDQGNPVRSVPLEINNLGSFIDLTTETIWGARVTVAVDGVSETWAGKIQNWSQSSDSVLSVVAVEDSKEVFKKLLPDEVIRVSEYNDVTREATSTPVPIPFGGSHADPLRGRGVVVDRVNFRYLFCVGEIREIVAVWKDREAITTGFTSYLGTSGQAVYPGFVYIEFASDPRDSAGRWPEILIDYVGLKLDGAFTEAQSRNPARVLYYLLTTASSGVGGWGLGVAAGDVDTTSFDTAVTDCDTVGFKLDGAISEQRTAAIWIDQICRSCRGALSFTGGKWVFKIDKDSASVKTFTTENMLLRNIGKGASSERKNRVVVDYRLDPVEGRFLGSATREDSTSQTAIGINESRPQLLLVRDHTAAGIVADYMSNLEVYGELRIEFSTKDFTNVVKDSVITITRSDLGLAAALFRVQRITINSGIAVIEARGYSEDIFDVSAGSPTTDPPIDPNLQGLGVQAPPGAVSGLNLSTGNTVLTDGTTVAYVDGTYTAGTGFLFAVIEYGEGASPGSWINVGASADGAFHIQPLKNGTLYTVRVTAKNGGGSATPVTGTITTSTDVTAPGKPQTPVLTVYFKSIAVKCLQNATKAPDMAGFKVFRHTSNASASATEIGFVACSGTEESVVFLDESTAYGTTYYYWLKPVDRTGNVGVFSDVAIGSTLQIVAGDITTGTITATQIAAATITADRLNVACLSAISANMGTVTAGTICAVTVCGATIHASTICSSTLCSATIYSNAGCIAGWNLTANYLEHVCAGSGGIYLYTNCYHTVYTFGCISGGGITYAMHGKLYDCLGWRQDAYGYSVSHGSGRYAFAAGVTTSNTFCLPDSSSALGTGCQFFWVGSTGAYAKYYNGALTVCGTLYATSGNIGGFTLAADKLCNSCVVSSNTVSHVMIGCYHVQAVRTVISPTTQCNFVCIDPYSIYSYYCYNSSYYYYYTHLNNCNGACMANAPMKQILTASAYCAVYCACNQLYSYGWGSVSDINQKDIWIPEYAVLPKLRTLPVYQWTYRGGHRSSRLGPLAQDFAAQFPEFSPEPEALPPLDGFLMKAVQELDCCNETLRECVSFLENRLANIESKLSSCA